MTTRRVTLALATAIALGAATGALALTSPTVAGAAPAQTSCKNCSPPPPGAVRTKKACKQAKYKTHLTLTTADKKPAITHISTYTIGAKVKQKVTKKAAYAETVKTNWHVAGKGTVSTGEIEKLLGGSVSGTLGASYRSKKGHTSLSSVKVTTMVTNNSNKNHQYVFYAGVIHGYGKFRKYFCENYYINGYDYGPSLVTYYPGTWTSWAIPGNGGVSCAAGRSGLGALAKAAYKIGCSA